MEADKKEAKQTGRTIKLESDRLIRIQDADDEKRNTVLDLDAVWMMEIGLIAAETPSDQVDLRWWGPVASNSTLSGCFVRTMAKGVAEWTVEKWIAWKDRTLCWAGREEI